MLDSDFHYTSARLAAVVFSPGTPGAAAAYLNRDPGELFHALLRDQEHEPALYAAKQVIDSRLSAPVSCAETLRAAACTGRGLLDLSGLLEFLDARGSALTARMRQVIEGEARVRRAVLRERAAVALVANCWCDTVSQPATQPGASVNVLFGQHFAWLGEGLPERAMPELRTRAMNEDGVILPSIIDRSFADKAEPTDSTALMAAYMVSLSRYPANYYAETLGTHLAYHALGLDTALYGVASPITSKDLRDLLESFLAELAGRPDAQPLTGRLLHAVGTMVDLEGRQASLLEELAQRTATQNLDSRVADLVRRHAPLAGRHHHKVRIDGEPLSETFAASDAAKVDLAAFMAHFRGSFYLRAGRDGSCAFIRALKFGGPMFGIFNSEEARVFADWARDVAQSPNAPVVLDNARPTDAAGCADLAALRVATPRDIVLDDTPPVSDRELFYRLVNIENFPATLAVARARAEDGLTAARALFECGAQGRYTDGSFFAYAPQALLDRVDEIYWQKLVGPYAPLQDIPSRAEVIFQQKTFALGNLVDGAWSYRIGNAGRYDRICDGKLFLIHADEMGLGDVRKNHITLIRQVLDSMDIHLPHISDAAFLEQDELPDEIYGFAINQLALALFPDSLYPEIVGYNLGIEMFGLGELRMHEIQKLKHHGLNAIYEEAHLSIDNASSGHARQSAEIVNDYLDDVKRRFGEERQQEIWQRVWNGYCSFARYVEIGTIDLEQPASAAVAAEPTEDRQSVTTI